MSARRGRRSRLIAVCTGVSAFAFAAGLLGNALATTTTTTTTTTATFTSVADSWIGQNRPDTNFGTDKRLKVQGSPIQRGYLRFNLEGLSGAIRKVTLRLNSASSSSVGYSVRAVADNSWGERTITYSNAPPPSSTIAASSGSFASGQWVAVDVTPLVSGNGLRSMALTSTSTTGMLVNSRESGTSLAPQLVVETTTDVRPANTSPPTISGTARDGQTLAADPGSWSGTQPISYAYQWRRCDSSGASCTNVPSAVSSSYLVGSTDVGSTLGVLVTASNAAGSSDATSAQTAVVTSGSGGGPCGTSTTPPESFQHVIWIWMENKAYSQIIGNTTSAPYTNSLASQCGVATNYHAVTHPSLPNYIAATSGDYWGIADDDSPAAHPLLVPSIYSQVKATGATWRDYEESATGNCPQDSSGLYAVKHDPAAYYTSISSDCAQWDVPMGSTTAGNFVSDLNADSLPAFSFVTPDMCNDTHDCPIATGDAWLQAWVPVITSSRAYQSGSTVVFITYDEDDGSATNRVATVVISPYTHAGTASATAFDHYSLLKTTEQLLGIGTFLGHAGDASTNSMRSDFNLSGPPMPPANTSPPAITGTSQEGQALTASSGAWSGTQPIAYARQWRRCDSSGANCVDIPGATAQTYALASVDVGSTMRVVVTASNSAGSSSATSTQTAVVQAAPAEPSNTSPPTIAGTAQAGQTLTASPGSWSGTQPISFAYQWRRCDAAGANCVDIVPMATQTYTLSSADVGASVRVSVTASNSAGSSTASSAQTTVVQPASVVPSNTSPPTIAGTAQVGQTLTASPGGWSGTQPITYAYQWRRCDTSGASCADIAGATSQSYPLSSAEVNSTLRVVVSASNSAGSSTATSAQSAVVAAAAGCAPRSSSYSNTVLATAGLVGYWRLGEGSGTVACDNMGANNGAYQSGTTLGQPGALTNDPDTAVAFNGSSGWVQVPPSSSLNVGDVFTVEAWVKRGTLSDANSYVVASKQANAWNLWLVDSFLVLRKSGNADLAASTVKIADTAWHQVAATKNAATVRLYIDGRDVTGTVTNLTMQNNTNALSIGQSSSAAFFNGTIDEVALYNVPLTATQISSHYAAAVANNQSPSNSSPPTISGTTQVGQTLTASPGSWSGTQPISYAYQWRRCNQAGTACTDIFAATAPTYTLTASDVGSTVAVTVTATNAAGSASASSTATAVVGSSVGDPVIAAAGDIACDPSASSFNGGLGTASACRQKSTSDLLVGQGFAAVLALGDNQYECGGFNAFLQAYDPAWGRVKEITHPVPGNHEYQTSGGTNCDAAGGASGYFNYFGAAAGVAGKGYYSYDVGTWHLIALNSQCSAVGGCASGSVEERWLRDDLAAHPNACTLVYWHHPRFTSGQVGNDTEVAAFWQDIYAAGGDVVLNGHAHGYERFAPQDPSENYDPAHGIREFVVGTGGEDLHVFTTSMPLTEIRDGTVFGVLKLTLHATSYDWQFVPVTGQTFTDSGSTSCR